LEGTDFGVNVLYIHYENILPISVQCGETTAISSLGKVSEPNPGVAQIKGSVSVRQENVSDDPETWTEISRSKRGGADDIPRESSPARPPTQSEDPEETCPKLNVSGETVKAFPPNVRLRVGIALQGTGFA
jgi:hypothetical protein